MEHEIETLKINIMEKQKIEQIVTEELNKYDMELPNYEYDAVTARITERIVKLFAIPAVVGRSEQFKCEKCGSDWGEVRATCFSCNHESEDLST